jgi:hypothetical protein
MFPEGIQEYLKSILLLQDELQKQIQDFKIMEPEFMLYACSLKQTLRRFKKIYK